MFVCGPTVYDSVHLGHARTYLVYDVLIKYLKTMGFNTTFIVNITDIDDKVFEKAELEGVNFEDLAEKYTQEFIKCLALLKINSIDSLHKASIYLNEIEIQIDYLVKNGYAYNVKGNIFFDIDTFPSYGILSKQTPFEIMLRRLNPDPNKRDQRDFVLWRNWVSKYPSFQSKFGVGRPGWHIEDTAISVSVLGGGYDIHGGGIDLIFPHHEAEIAQGESFTDQHPFVKYWIHTGLLFINGEKMSKSLGNVITLKDALNQWKPDVLRFYLLSQHYRKTFDFNINEINNSQNKLNFIYAAIIRIRKKVNNAIENSDEPNKILQIQYYIETFFKALDDDLDIPKSISVLIDLITLMDQNMVGVNQNLLNKILKMLSIIGLDPLDV